MPEDLTYTMKVKRDAPYSVNGSEGIKFHFYDFDGQHDETLQLKRDGELIDGARNSPLYKLQDLDPDGEMVIVTFGVITEKRQEAQEGNRRDRVQFKRGLRVKSVRPVPETRLLPTASARPRVRPDEPAVHP